MYKNIGNKIKSITKTLTIIGIICSLLLAFLGFYVLAEVEEGVGIFMITYGITLAIITWISSWFMYAFGELVQNSTELVRIQSQLLAHSKQAPVNMTHATPIHTPVATPAVTPSMPTTFTAPLTPSFCTQCGTNVAVGCNCSNC